jgi:hypothetical protein
MWTRCSLLGSGFQRLTFPFLCDIKFPRPQLPAAHDCNFQLTPSLQTLSRLVGNKSWSFLYSLGMDRPKPSLSRACLLLREGLLWISRDDQWAIACKRSVSSGFKVLAFSRHTTVYIRCNIHRSPIHYGQIAFVVMFDDLWVILVIIVTWRRFMCRNNTAVYVEQKMAVASHTMRHYLLHFNSSFAMKNWKCRYKLATQTRYKLLI